MTRTFLVELEIGTDPVLIVADEIREDLSANFDVISVKPWASPGQPIPSEPTTQNQQTPNTN